VSCSERGEETNSVSNYYPTLDGRERGKGKKERGGKAKKRRREEHSFDFPLMDPSCQKKKGRRSQEQRSGKRKARILPIVALDRKRKKEGRKILIAGRKKKTLTRSLPLSSQDPQERKEGEEVAEERKRMCV